MIKPKLAFLQMEIKSMFLHSPETNQASFCIGPETFYSVNMTMLIGKFILSVLHSIVLLITKVYEAIIATPAIRVNDAFGVYTASDNALQSGPGTVWNYFCIYTALPFKKTKYNRFSPGPSPSKPTNTASAKIAFINLNLARNRRFSLTGKGYSLSYSLE